MLERRQLLSAAVSNVFATFDGTVAAGKATDVPVQITSRDFTLSGGGKAMLGFHLSAGAGSSLDPATTQVRDANGQLVRPHFDAADLPQGKDSDALVELGLGKYTLSVAGAGGTAGAYHLDVYLVGDANGDRSVNAADSNVIHDMLGAGGTYTLAADTDLDGRITGFDQARAITSAGASTKVDPLAVTIAILPSSTVTLGDGSLLTNSPAISVTGTTNPGAGVTLDQDGDGFDDGSGLAAGDGRYTLAARLVEGANTLRILAADTFGQQRTAAVRTTLDTRAPVLNVTGPTPGLLTNHNVTVSGRATDSPAGIGLLEARIDGGAWSAVAVDASGNFSLPTNLPLDHTADGAHVVGLRATDRAGNVSPEQTVTLTLDTRPPTATIGPTGTLTDPIPSFDVTFSEAVAAGAFSAAAYTLQSGGGAIPITSVTKVNDTTVRITPASPLGDGSYSFAIDPALTDLAGNQLAGPRTFTFAVQTTVGVTEISPANGEEMVGLERETVVRFSGKVDPSTVNADSFYLIANGHHLAGTIRVSPTERFATFFQTDPLPAATEVRVVVDGSRMHGRNGQPIDANNDGANGGVATADFRTLPLTRIQGTNVWGYVYDSYHKNPDGSNIPVVGATIRVDALPQASVTTDANGFFELRDMPAPSFFVHVDGTTATNAPAGTMYPSVGKEFMSVPGHRTQLIMDGTPFNVYLPPMATSDVVTLSPTRDTVVGFGANGKAELADLLPDVNPAVWDRMKVTYPAGSAVDKQGNAATQATIIPVPPDRLPAPLPPTQNPKLVISIQAIGATNFETPAPVTFPNLEGLAPGEKSLIWSFNHSAGRWEVIGTGTVSDDGLAIESDPGVGILAPGWHFTQVGTPAAGQQCTDDQCVLVNGGRRGDVIEVNLAGTGGTDFSQVSLADGQVIYLDPADIPLGHFYFIPDVAGTVPFVSGSFQGTLTRANDEGQTETKRETGTLRINIDADYSTSGPNAVTAGTDKLSIYRQQQRLRFLGFRGSDGALVVVDGSMGPNTRHAIGVFNAACTPGEDVNVTASSSLNIGFANSPKAPCWRQAIGGTGWTKGAAGGHDWGTSWAIEVMDAAGARNTGPTLQSTHWSLQAGGDTPSHGTHEAGMDVDLETPSTDDGNTPFYATRTIAGRRYVAAESAASGKIVLTKSDGTYEAAAPVTDPSNSAYNLNRALLSDDAWDDREVLYGIRNLIFDPPGYNVEDIKKQIAAFNGVVTASGASALSVYYNDPRTWSGDGTSGFVHFVSGHGGHFHVNINPPSSPNSPQPFAQAAVSVTAAVSTESGFGNDSRPFYRFRLSNGFVIAGRARLSGAFSEVLSPNTEFVLTLYDSAHNKSGIYSGRSNASGYVTDLGPIILDQFGGPDTDGDGIPDVGEDAIGSNPRSVDSDGDGISDSAEITQGLDPLDGRAFPTGVISSLPLFGQAKSISVEDNTAYIATGSYGLAVVDATQFRSPVVLGQLDLAGDATDIAVDPNLKIATVASGAGGLHLVNVADGMLPTLIRTVNINAAQVEVIDGVAYAAVGTTLQAIDLLTGANLQTLQLPGSGVVSGMAREGSKLYVFVSGSDTFVTVDASHRGAAAVRGQLVVSVASTDVGVTVGNGVAYLAGSGLRTINVSNISSPTLIHGADFFFTARGAALNGSGLALVAAEGQGLGIYNVSDPNNTNNFVLQVPTGGFARNVAIASGIAFVANDTGGLVAINYLPFDSRGTPPTVSITSPAADIDPATPGIQISEGGTIPVRATVTDDVQVRNVELLVNGQVVQNAVSFPFDLAGVAVDGGGGGGTVSVQVRAWDTGGNFSLSNVLTFNVVPDTFPPTVVSIDPGAGAQKPEGSRSLSVRFSEPIKVDGNAADAFRLVGAGPDGTFGTADDVVVEFSNIQFLEGDTLVQLTTAAGLAVDSYELRVDRSRVTDRVGNALGTGTLSQAFTVVPFSVSPEFLPFGTSQLTFTDDVTIQVPALPFAFDFFGQPVSGPMYISSNGLIEFGTSTVGGEYENQRLPLGGFTGVAAYWDDLYPPAGGRIGYYDGDGVRAITWELVPYYGRGTSPTVTFQIALYANGTIVIRYGTMGTPPGGTADSGVAVGTATIGLARGSVVAIPSLGNIANEPTVGITDAGGILNSAGLARLDTLSGTDLLVFTPDGAGRYTITHNPLG